MPMMFRWIARKAEASREVPRLCFGYSLGRGIWV